MTTKVYTIRITSPLDPDVLDTEIRRAVEHLSNAIDGDGEQAVAIHVTDIDGRIVTGHFYDPAEFAS